MWLCIVVLVVRYSFVQGQIPPSIIEFAENGTGKTTLDEPNNVKARFEGLKLLCKTTGSVPMTFSWKYNNKPLTKGRGIEIMKTSDKPNQEVLWVQNISPRDDGKYQCFAKNANGGTFTAKLRVKVTFANQFKEAESVVTPLDVVVGKSLRLMCPPKKESLKDFGTVYLWTGKEDGGNNLVNLPSNRHRALLPNGDFLFLYLSKEDVKEIAAFKDGGVQCNVIAGNLIYFSKRLQLKVKSTDKNNFGPEFNSPDDHPKNQEQAIRGKSKEMYCAAVGFPVPDITWYRLKDDKTVDTKIENGKGGFLLTDFGRKLRIDVVSKVQHEYGYYQCMASNGVGPDVKSSPTKLEVFVAPIWTSEPPKEFSVPIESDSYLLCEALGTPTPTYKWYYNGTEFTSDEKVDPKNIKVDGKYLRFFKMEQQNQGVFQCAVENDYGMLVSSTWVKVKASKPDIQKFGPFYLFKGTNASLKCESNAAPRAAHTWFHNGKKLEMTGRYSLDKEGSLEIHNVGDSDGGKYKCDARNSIGQDSAESDATVYEKTTIFRKPPKNVFITLDTPLDLQCEARADPRLKNFLKYKWLKDNAPLRYDDRVIWMSGMNLLRITKAIITDGAMYKCVAYTDTRQYSEDSASTIADVQGVPFPPYDLKITECSNGSTTITWKKGQDNDSPTTKFIIEQESTYYPEEWIVIANITDPSQRQYTLKLTLWADLTFRMRAVNTKGPSRASLPTPKKQCVTKQGLPKMFPKNLRGIPGKAYELDIAWEAMTKLQANAPGLHYILYYAKANASDFLPPVTINDPSIERFKVPNAGYYEKWKFQIVAKNKIGQGPISDIKESYSGQNAPKDKPTDVQITKILARSIELSWNRVNIQGRGSIDGYKIYFWGQSKSDNAIRTRRDIPPGASVFTAPHTTKDRQTAIVTGLTPYSSYTLALKAFNSGGEGPSSDEQSFETKEDVPGEVSTFKAYAFSQYIFASWGEPEDKNGILLGYSIAAVKHEDNEKIKTPPASAFKDVPVNSFEYLFVKMKEETRYVVYLRAKTKIGPGKYQQRDIKTIDMAKPARPRAPIVNAKTTTSVNVTFLFGESPGGYPLEFMVKYRETATNASYKETSWFNHLEKRWAEVDGLAIDRLHDFVTVGRNKEGLSVDSPITKARPLAVVGTGKRVSTPFYRTPWFIILMVLILVLLILLLVAILYTRKRGAKYPVGKREKQRAGILDNPDEEDMVDMTPVDDRPPPYRQDSMEKNNYSDDDRDSLDDYGDGQNDFKEDGSFIEEYGDDKKKLEDKSATATFV